jgi:FHS family Na+ dependent glucose MFS transporter 1
VLSLKRRREPAPVYLVGFVAAGAAFTFAGPALVMLKRQVGVGTGTIGIVFSAVGLGYLVSALLVAKGYDRGWGNRLLAGALAVLAVALVCVPEASSLATLTLTFVFVGASIAAVDVGTNTLMVWRTGTASGSWLAALHFCFGVGALLSPLGVRLSQVHRGDVALVCWMVALLAALAAVGVLQAESPRRPAELAEPQTTEMSPSRRHLVFSIVVFFYLYVGVESGFAAWLYTYATEIDMSSGSATALITTFWACFTAGRLLAIVLARSISAFRLVVSSSLLAAIALFAMVVARGNPAVVWPATAVLGFAVAPQFPLMIAFAGAQTSLAAATTASFVATAGVANLTLPWCIGQLIAHIGPEAMPAAILVLSLGTLVALSRVAKVANLRRPIELWRERRAEAVASR